MKEEIECEYRSVEVANPDSDELMERESLRGIVKRRARYYKLS
jgi:hypothetical protein